MLKRHAESGQLCLVPPDFNEITFLKMEEAFKKEVIRKKKNQNQRPTTSTYKRLLKTKQNSHFNTFNSLHLTFWYQQLSV